MRTRVSGNYRDKKRILLIKSLKEIMIVVWLGLVPSLLSSKDVMIGFILIIKLVGILTFNTTPVFSVG